MLLNQHTKIISNRWTRRWIAFRMASCVCLLILRRYPFYKVFTILKTVNRRKELLQGFSGIPGIYKNDKRYYYSLHTPGWPSKAFNRFFTTEIFKNIPGREGTYDVQNVIFSVTARCQLNCRHCYEWDNLRKDEHLTSNNLMAILEKLRKNGISIVQVSGGEPIERFYDCFNLAMEGRTYADFWFLTSGYGLDRFKAQLLKYGGYTGVNISLDHWDPDKHNSFRGDRHSFRWVQDAAKNTIDSGLLLAFTICMTEEFVTAENLNKYLALARTMGASYVQFLEPRRAGRYKDNPVELSKDSIKLLGGFYEQVNNDSQYRDYPSIIYHGHYQRQEGCLGAANRYFYIDSLGEAHACPFCRDSAGNVLVEDLRSIFARLRKAGCQKFQSYS